MVSLEIYYKDFRFHSDSNREPLEGTEYRNDMIDLHLSVINMSSVVLTKAP